MSLIKCPECGNNLSSYALSCPKCGLPKESFDDVISDKQKEQEFISYKEKQLIEEYNKLSDEDKFAFQFIELYGGTDGLYSLMFDYDTSDTYESEQQYKILNNFEKSLLLAYLNQYEFINELLETYNARNVDEFIKNNSLCDLAEFEYGWDYNLYDLMYDIGHIVYKNNDLKNEFNKLIKNYSIKLDSDLLGLIRLHGNKIGLNY